MMSLVPEYGQQLYVVFDATSYRPQRNVIPTVQTGSCAAFETQYVIVINLLLYFRSHMYIYIVGKQTAIFLEASPIVPF